MPDGEKTIKVVDRRLFTADGELRDEARAEMEAPDAPAPAPAAPAPPAEPPPETPPAVLRLLEMLGQTAALYREGFPDPATGRRQIDLQGARQIIDSLAALRDKTRGRLSFQHKDALERLLGQLQLAFTRLAAPPAGRPAGSPPARRG